MRKPEQKDKEETQVQLERINQGKDINKEQKVKILEFMRKRRQRNMDERIKKFIIDALNLIFGKGEETDHFWNEILFKQCVEYFGLDEAIDYHEYPDGQDEILNRS